MASWHRDGLSNSHQWVFDSDDLTWRGKITNEEGNFAWWVQVPAPAWEGVDTHMVKGNASDLDQAKRLSLGVAKVLCKELGSIVCEPCRAAYDERDEPYPPPPPDGER